MSHASLSRTVGRSLILQSTACVGGYPAVWRNVALLSILSNFQVPLSILSTTGELQQDWLYKLLGVMCLLVNEQIYFCPVCPG